MRTRLDGSDQLQDRVAELEERVDFAERILAEGKRPDQLRASSSQPGREAEWKKS